MRIDFIRHQCSEKAGEIIPTPYQEIEKIDGKEIKTGGQIVATFSDSEIEKYGTRYRVTVCDNCGKEVSRVKISGNGHRRG